MNNAIKILFFVFCIMFVSANYAHAQIVNNPWGVPINLPFQSQLEMRICMIRRIFCGSFIVAVVTIVVFIIGIMLLNNKLPWGTAVIMVSGLVVFTEAESIAGFFGRSNYIIFISSPMCKCSCTATVWGLDFGLVGSLIQGNAPSCL